MTDHLSTDRPQQPSPRRSAAKLVMALAITAPLGAALVPAGSSHADPTDMTNPSYQQGYTKAVKDGQIAATRMRAEGVPQEYFVVSSRIPALCAKESASVQALAGVKRGDFFRGCATGMRSLVDAGVAN